MARNITHLGKGVVNVNQAWQDASSKKVGGDFSVRTSQRVSKSHRTGKKKFKNFKWDIHADDLIVDTRAGEINGVFTGLLQTILADNFSKVTRQVAPATQARRKSMADGGSAFQTYQRRYAGGRIGHLPPGGDTDDLWLRDSGRMQRTTIRLRNRSGAGGNVKGATGNIHSKGTATINLPANRLDPAHPDWRGRHGQAQLEHVLGEIPVLLPVLGKWDSATQAMVNKGVDALLSGLVANSRRRFEALQRRKNIVMRQLLRALGVNADFLVFTQQIRLQRQQRIGQRVSKETIG